MAQASKRQRWFESNIFRHLADRFVDPWRTRLHGADRVVREGAFSYVAPRFGQVRGTSDVGAHRARPMDTVVITARGSTGPLYTGNTAYRAYPAKITIHEDGLALSLIPPFNVLCPSIHLPFDEMSLEPTDWALWPEPFAIRMHGLPDIDIVLGRDTVQWLRSGTDRSPFGWEG